ncbi:amino acid adenylation domain-containing protein [Streptomyces sp. NPDC058284]|uniref:non-ribosomal peptide synthetase n=1 Tax=unclassified Streptomyces TaxID=2593676 RepID=UPI003669AD5D
MSELVKRLAKLPESRRAEFLAQLRSGAEGRRGQELAPRNTQEPAPLSHAQETLWFIDRLAPGRATYNVAASFRIRGALDVPALGRALRTVVTRHETLRTSLVDAHSGLVQRVLPADDHRVTVPLAVRDLSSAPQGAAAAGRDFAAELGRTPFDLTRAPLWRAGLALLGDEDHLFVFVVHHVVFDGWSAGVFVDELSAAYAAETAPRAADAGAHADADADSDALAPLPVQYGDYAEWQRRRLTGDTYEQLAAYWRERFTGAPTLELPTDRTRPTETTYDGTYLRQVLAPELTGSVARLARSCGVTPYVVHLSAFLLLLHRYSGQDDIVIGTPTANRDQVEVERLIGFFVNMLPLRADLSGAPTFRELVGRVGELAREAFAHGELPFEKIVEVARPRRDPSRSPLFQVVFAFHNTVDNGLGLPGLDVRQEYLDAGTSRFDLSWNVTERPEGSVVEAEFNTDLFDHETVEGFLDHYEQALTAVLADPELTVPRTPLLTPAARKEMVTRWNGPALAVPDLSVPALFEERVRATPHAVALVADAERLTYAELNRRANRLARVLRARGAAPGERVALCLRRTPDLIAGVLAVLKSGAAYVPVDPGYPQARMASILDDAAPVAVLAHEECARSLPGGHDVLVLEELADAVSGEADDDPAFAVAPGDVAYVLYTSGTTGRPKGVLIEHHSVIGFVAAMRDLFEITPDDRVLGYASANFDVSVGEMFNALLTGAQLHLVADEVRLDVGRLQELLEKERVSVVDLPPAVLALLDPDRLPDLRIVFVGGEAFPGELVNRWNREGHRFFNGYGPTECTVTMVVHECPGHWDASPPIGLPIANHVAHVVDEHLEPVPYGVVGELLVGGEGLTRGYLGEPGLTREKVIADPFDSTADGRLYHTGDLVRRLRDGSLVFVGRKDQQVKIRGLRIELGDVEAALASCPGVSQVAVVPWADPQGERHLVAYTASSGETVEPARLRAHAADRLPGYMVPSFFVALETLPLTVSGKVDQRALPDPDPDRSAVRENGGTLPRTETERVIAEEIFARTLRRDRVGVHDDFFAIGGNSLQAAQLMSLLSERFQVRVGLAEFFRSPTVAHLAETVDRLRDRSSGSDDLLALIEGMSDADATRLMEAGTADITDAAGVAHEQG